MGEARPCDGSGRVLIGGEEMGWWQDCKGCANCLDELLIESLWCEQTGVDAVWRAKIRVGGKRPEWRTIELPAGLAERIVADLKVAMADLRKLLDS